MMRKSIGTPVKCIFAFCLFVSVLSKTFVAGSPIANVLKMGDTKNTLIFENRINTNHNGNPIIVQIEIRGRNKPTKWKIKKTLMKAISKTRYPPRKDLKDLIIAKELFKTKMFWNKNRKVWVVRFFFTQAYDNTF